MKEDTGRRLAAPDTLVPAVTRPRRSRAGGGGGLVAVLVVVAEDAEEVGLAVVVRRGGVHRRVGAGGDAGGGGCGGDVDEVEGVERVRASTGTERVMRRSTAWQDSWVSSCMLVVAALYTAFTLGLLAGLLQRRANSSFDGTEGMRSHIYVSADEFMEKSVAVAPPWPDNLTVVKRTGRLPVKLRSSALYSLPAG